MLSRRSLELATAVTANKPRRQRAKPEFSVPPFFGAFSLICPWPRLRPPAARASLSSCAFWMRKQARIAHFEAREPLISKKNVVDDDVRRRKLTHVAFLSRSYLFLPTGFFDLVALGVRDRRRVAPRPHGGCGKSTWEEERERGRRNDDNARAFFRRRRAAVSSLDLDLKNSSPPQKKNQSTQLKKLSQRAPALAAPSPCLLVEAKQGGGKLKTKKAASKRIKVTATGKVLVRKAGKQHINEKMSSAKLNEKSKMARVPDRELPNVIKCLPYAGISK